jgi:hypothetical protein
MTSATIEIFKAALRADSTIGPDERTHLLGILKNGNPTTTKAAPRIVRRAEAAQRLSVSLRMVDKLTSEGVLKKRILPGRKRGCGFLESDLLQLVYGRAA